MSEKCKFCGEELKDGAKFCGSCGAKVDIPAAPQAPEQPAYNAPDKPAYSAPDKPAYSASDKPAYSAPEQSAYSAPDKPAYSAPEKPAYSAPDKPAYGAAPYAAPAQPTYTGGAQPSSPIGYQPAQPSPQQPVQPRYYAPTTPGAQGQYGQPPYGAPGYGVPQPQPQKKSKVGLIIGIVVGAIVLLIIAVIVIASLSGGGSGGNSGGSGGSSGGTSDNGGQSKPAAGAASYEKVVEEYMKGIEALGKGDGKFSDMMYKTYEWHYAKPAFKSTIQEAIDEQDESLEESFGAIRAYSSDFSVTYTIDRVTTMTSSEQEDYISDNSIDLYCDTSSIEEICICETTMTMHIAGVDSDSDVTLTCIKADGTWYLSYNGIE